MIRLSGLRLEEIPDRSSVRLAADMVQAGESTTLWFEFDERFREFITTDRYDAFLTAALVPAMQACDAICVEGAVSEKLLYSYQTHFQPEVAVLNPDLKTVPIQAGSWRPREGGRRGEGVVVGYSGGIDSMFTVLSNLDLDIPPRYKFSHLLFTNIGTHGNSVYGDVKRARGLFDARAGLIRQFADAVDLKLVTVDSNLHEQLPWRLLSSIITGNVAAAQALQGLFCRIYYPSQLGLSEAHEWTPGELDSYMPKLATEMSTELLECRSTDGQYSRVDKTQFLAEQPLAWKYLDVCVTQYGDGYRNCTTDCIKCARTVVTLDVLGRLDDFAEVFDLEKYASRRPRLLRRLLVSGKADEYAAYLIEYARETGFKWPFKVRLGAAANRTERFVRKGIKPVKSLFR